MVSADGTVIDDDVPSPKCHSIPLLDFKSLLAADALGITGGGALPLADGSGRGGVGHIDIGHGESSSDVVVSALR